MKFKVIANSDLHRIERLEDRLSDFKIENDVEIYFHGWSITQGTIAIESEYDEELAEKLIKLVIDSGFYPKYILEDGSLKGDSIEFFKDPFSLEDKFTLHEMGIKARKHLGKRTYNFNSEG